MDRRRAAGCLLALAACFAFATAAPTASNQTALDLYDGAPDGCYYNFQHYGEGDRIMTNEPCLNCTCHNRMLMCYLRVCPFTKPIGQDCTIEKRADQCCPIVTCPDVPVDLLTSTTNSPAEYGATGLGKLDKYGCSINNKYFPEGSKVPSTPNKPCEHCYCIRNMTTCVMQECTLHVDGCTPIYHKDVCCPVRYSCDHPEGETPLLDDMSTTVRPTPGFLLTTTTLSPVTQISQDCVYDNRIFPDGALIKTEKACDHCYCMKGDIVCVVQECGTPMENEGKNCTALPPREGVCCPDTYICEGDEPATGSNDGSEFTTNLPQETLTTLSPPRRTGSEGSGYRNEDTTPYTETPLKEIVEGSGDDEGFTDSTQPSDNLGSSYETEEPHEYISVTTKQPLIEHEITTKAYTEPEATKSTLDKLQDQELGSGEEEKDQDNIPEISSATTVSSVQEETTVPYVHDIIHTKTTEQPESQVKTSTTIPDRKEDTTILPQELITSSKDKSETTDILPTQETTVPAIDDAMMPHSSTIVPIAEDLDRKATPSEQNIPVSTTEKYESEGTAKPEDFSSSSTAAPGLEKEISTEAQEIVTERSEKPEIELHPYPTVTASTPMLEEIEKETTEFSEKEPTSSEIVIPSIDSEFSTSIPFDKDQTGVTETSDNIDEDISDYITTISPTFETDYITTQEPEKSDDFEDHSLINVIDKEATPSDKPTELFEDKTEYYSHTTSASKIDQNRLTTTEPNKELNTIPGVEEHNREPSEPEKTTISDIDEEIPLGNRYNDSPNVSTSVTSAPADESPATPTTEMIKEDEDHKVTEMIITLSDKFDKSTPSPTNYEDVQTELPPVEKSTPGLEEITAKPTDESTNRPDDLQTDQMSQVTTSSYDKMPDTTLANLDENEIFNEPRIPGEGDCLLNGVTYRNESAVPSANKCLSDCKCISSIVKCDPIICSPPPEYMESCRTMYDSTDSCCPTYICDHKTETIPPQPHSQMSGTESPAVPSIQCHGDDCAISGVDKQAEASPEPCTSGSCPSQTDTNLGGDVSQPVTTTPVKACEGDECKSESFTTTPVKPCEGDECKSESFTTTPVKPCEGDECKSDSVTTTPIKPCEGDECKNTIDETSPDVQPQPCSGLDCSIPIQEQEISKETCQGDGDCKKQDVPFEIECKGDSCRRKDSPAIDQQIPVQCSGSECPQIDTSASTECKDDNCRPKDTSVTDQQIPVQTNISSDIESTTSTVSKPITSPPESQSVDSEESATTKRTDEEEIMIFSTTELPQEKEEPKTTKASDEITTAQSISEVESTTKAVLDSERVTETSKLDETETSEKSTDIPDIQYENTTPKENIHTVKVPPPVTEINEIEEEKNDQSETQPEESYTITATPVVKDETSGFDKNYVSTESEKVSDMSTESYKPEEEKTTSDIEKNKIQETFTTEATKVTDSNVEATLNPLDEATKDKVTVEAEVDTATSRPSVIESEASTHSPQIINEEVTVVTKVENVAPTSDSISESGEVGSTSESEQDVQPVTEENIDSTKLQQEISLSSTPSIISQEETTLISDKDQKEGITEHDVRDSESTTIKTDKVSQDITVSNDLDATTIKVDESAITQSASVTTPSFDERDKTVTEKIIPSSEETEKPSTIIDPSEKDTTDSTSLFDYDPEKSTPSEVASQKPEEIFAPTTELYDLVTKVSSLTDNTVTESQKETSTRENEVEQVDTEITSKSPDSIEDVTTVTKLYDLEPETDVTVQSHEIERTDETSTLSYVVKETTKTVENRIQDTTPSSTTQLEDIETVSPSEITKEPQKPYEIESSSVKDVEEPTTQLTQTSVSEPEKVPSLLEPNEEATTKSSIETSQTTEADILKETISSVIDPSTEPTIKTSEQDNLEGTDIQSLVTEKVTVPTDFERKPEYQTTELSASYDKGTEPQEIVTITSDEEFEITTRPTAFKPSSVSAETDVIQTTTPKNIIVTSEPITDLSTTPESSKDESVPDKWDVELEKSTTPTGEEEKESDISITTPPKTNETVTDKIPLQSSQDIETATDAEGESATSKPQDELPHEAITVSDKDEGKDSTTTALYEKETTKAPQTQEVEDNKDITTPPQLIESESKPTQDMDDQSTEKITELDTSSQSPESQTTTIPRDVQTTRAPLTDLYSSELPQEIPIETYPPLEIVTDKIQDIDQPEISTKSSDIPYYTESIPSSSESIEVVDKTTKSPESEITQEITSILVEMTKGPSEGISEYATESSITETSTKGLEETFEPIATSPKLELISETTEVEPAEATPVIPQKEQVTMSNDKLENPDIEIQTDKQPDIVEASTLKPEAPITLAEEYPTTSRIFEVFSTTAPAEEPSVSPDAIVETTPEVQSIPVSLDIDSDKTITTEEPISMQTEKVSDLSEKPLQKPSQETTTSEEDHMLSTTKATPTKVEEEIAITSPADKFSTPEEKPIETEEKPVEPEEKPIETEEKPVEPEEKPVEPEEKPAEPEEKPLEPEEKPVETEEKPVEPEEKPIEPEATPTPEQPKPIPSDVQPTDELPPPEEDAQFPPSGPNGYGDQDYMEEDQTFGPGTCRYGGKVYVSAQQIPRDDPCDFCFCFRSDIICLQQSCPPPIHGCHEEPISGFCCPRYECPVSMATTVNVTTTTTTTTTTVPPHFPIHSYKGSAQRKGCLIKGQSYKVGDVVRSSSGPCLHCTCGGDGQMKCDPKACTPEPMLRQMIAAAVSAKRRR